MYIVIDFTFWENFSYEQLSNPKNNNFDLELEGKKWSKLCLYSIVAPSDSIIHKRVRSKKGHVKTANFSGYRNNGMPASRSVYKEYFEAGVSECNGILLKPLNGFDIVQEIASDKGHTRRSDLANSVVDIFRNGSLGSYLQTLAGRSFDQDQDTLVFRMHGSPFHYGQNFAAMHYRNSIIENKSIADKVHWKTFGLFLKNLLKMHKSSNLGKTVKIRLDSCFAAASYAHLATPLAQYLNDSGNIHYRLRASDVALSMEPYYIDNRQSNNLIYVSSKSNACPLDTKDKEVGYSYSNDQSPGFRPKPFDVFEFNKRNTRVYEQTGWKYRNTFKNGSPNDSTMGDLTPRQLTENQQPLELVNEKQNLEIKLEMARSTYLQINAKYRASIFRYTDESTSVSKMMEYEQLKAQAEESKKKYDMIKKALSELNGN